MRELGFSLTVLLGAAGVLSVAIGFASQTSASNIISGLFLIAEKPFVIGDVITVGAVDVALQPAGFTSYGKSIDVYANGFEVPSKVPGGMPINISGTSLSAPQVTNLAGKILAVNPDLDVAQVRAIIEETATVEGTRKLKVINPTAALERARES